MILDRIEPLVSVSSAAEVYGLAPSFLYRLVARGDLPCYRIGKAIRLRLSEVEAYFTQVHEPGELEVPTNAANASR